MALPAEEVYSEMYSVVEETIDHQKKTIRIRSGSFATNDLYYMILTDIVADTGEVYTAPAFGYFKFPEDVHLSLEFYPESILKTNQEQDRFLANRYFVLSAPSSYSTEQVMAFIQEVHSVHPTWNIIARNPVTNSEFVYSYLDIPSILDVYFEEETR